ncbi:MAG TPA: alpha/beta hydrolase [Streptosporangiaceae bacterium]|nr:alpha/beta hydrolase [Streptosporangiaceae bacterium]
MSRWLRLTKAGGLAVGAVAAGAGVVIAAEKIAVGRLRLRPDPAADEPLGQLRGRPVTVLADDGVPLHAEVAGPDDAPVTIVFTHGYSLTQDCWHYQRQALEGTARLVFWDQRGHGRSPRMWPDEDPAGGVSIAQTGADLAAVLAATCPGDGPVLLVGHSMGGMTIMALAAQQPELFGTRVIGTALIATAAADVDPAVWLPPLLRPLARQAAPSVLRTAAQGRQAVLVERGRQAAGDIAFLSTRLIGFGDSSVSPTLVDFAERMIRSTRVEVIAEFYLALLDHDQQAALDVIGRAPAFVLTGDRDKVVASRLAGELAAGIPGADLILVPGAGHLVFMERPEVVNEAILALLARSAGELGAEPRTA